MLEDIGKSDAQGMMDPKQINAYVKVIRKKFDNSEKRKNRWRIEDSYYFESMKETIGSDFIKQLKETCEKYERIIFPMLTFSSIHWACAYIEPKKHKVNIVDSTYRGKDMEPYGKIITNAIQKAIGKRYKICYPDRHSKQFDSRNCGVHTLKNMEDLMLTGKTKIYTYDDKSKKDENQKILMGFRKEFAKAIKKDQQGKENKNIRKILKTKITDVSEELLYTAPDRPWKINSRDLQDLKDSEAWLNDDIIRAGIALIRPNIDKKSLIWDPIAYTLLKDAFINPTTQEDAIILSKFKRDVKNYNKIYFPYNYENTHWLLIMADTKNKVINVYDPEWYTNYSEVDIMKAMFKVPFGDDYEIRWQQNIPHQTDGYNCGMFLLENLRCLLLNNGKFDYTQGDLTRKRKELLNKLQDSGYV
jgi:Ulp1 family protease